MVYNTKYGPIEISDQIVKEFENLAHMPLSLNFVEEAMECLPDEEKSSKQKVEKNIIALGKEEQDFAKEVEEINNSGGLVVDMRPIEGVLDVDENGNFFINKS